MHSSSQHEILRSQWVTAGGRMRELGRIDRGDHADVRNILRCVAGGFFYSEWRKIN